ncbi:hypothetical protein [Bifidobacterium polysaccharolyticum]|nr:hypothetical protein [Bifidobacterium polysaccharolyticum]
MNNMADGTGQEQPEARSVENTSLTYLFKQLRVRTGQNGSLMDQV